MTTNIYANYGILSHEYETVYSATSHTDIYDTLAIEIPDNLYYGVNDCGETLLKLGGLVYTLDDVLKQVRHTTETGLRVQYYDNGLARWAMLPFAM